MTQTLSIPVPDPQIRQKRAITGSVAITHAGQVLADQVATVEQVSHQFLFGSTWGEDTLALANGELEQDPGRKAFCEQRNTRFLDLFNMVTLPFYWARFEPQRGQPQTQRLLKAAQWYRQRGCFVKGHPLCWHTLTAPWLLELTPEEIYAEQIRRIQRDVADFTGVIDAWDVINEAVIMPVFDKYPNGITRLCQTMGRIRLIGNLFEEVRAVDHHAVFLINDFDVSPAYDILVEGCLEAGIHIDVIGIQSHMHQGYWGKEKTEQILERFERFGLPIHFSETNLVSGALMPPEIVDLNDYQVSDWPTTPEGEIRQAEEVVTHYKTLLAHPLVQAITWWDFIDDGWLHAPAGLLRKDGSTKPAYELLLELIKGEWWLAPTQVHLDEAGRFNLIGFPGEYQVTVAGMTARFNLTQSGEQTLPV